MLAAHLNPDIDAASRKLKTIESTVRFWLEKGLIKSGDRVLDLGCGPGLYDERLAIAGVQVVGIDQSEDEKMTTRLERRYDIDWLRFLAICAVFLFHCGRFFDDGGWHVKNAQASFGMTVFVSVFAQWIMPIFFILSGISTYYSLSIKKQNGP